MQMATLVPSSRPAELFPLRRRVTVEMMDPSGMVQETLGQLIEAEPGLAEGIELIFPASSFSASQPDVRLEFRTDPDTIDIECEVIPRHVQAEKLARQIMPRLHRSHRLFEWWLSPNSSGPCPLFMRWTLPARRPVSESSLHAAAILTDLLRQLHAARLAKQI
jgi:hypothetical protein